MLTDIEKSREKQIEYSKLLKDLTQKCGHNVRFLTRRQTFKCQSCSEQKITSIQEQIENNEYSILMAITKEKQLDQVTIKSIPIFALGIKMKCRCASQNIVSMYDLPYIMKLLEEQKAVYETGKNPDYIKMYV